MERLWKKLGLWWWLVIVPLLFVVESVFFDISEYNRLGHQFPPPQSALEFIISLLEGAVLIWAGVWTYNELHPPPPPPPPPTPLSAGIFFGTYEGIPIGKFKQNDGHILVIGGSGTGKSSCIAIPTLRSWWDEPFVAVDIKGELEAKSGRHGMVFNPYRSDSYGYDPFYLVRKSDDPDADIRDIAVAIAPERQHDRDPFWRQSAQNLLAGFLTLAFHQGTSFIKAIRYLTDYSADAIIKAIAEEPSARHYVSSLLTVKGETVASIKQGLDICVLPFQNDKNISTILSKSPILTPDHVEAGQSAYLQIPIEKIERNRALFTLILSQYIQHFKRRPEGKNRPVLLLLDEFPQFGRIQDITSALETLRSKRVTICIILQSLAQLDVVYGQDTRRIILDNCAYKAILGATDPSTQKELSAMVGNHEVEKRSRMINPQGYESITISMKEEPHIRPEQFAYLKGRNELILLHENGWIALQKSRE
jgi:type IV secretion system protein VirD4